MTRLRIGLVAVLIVLSAVAAVAQQQSVKPGINDSFRNPDVQQFAGRFEVESREVYARRAQIVEACRITPGETVADIGAGTGLFTRLFSEAVGSEGRVIAVDIAQNFLDHIRQSSREAGLKNVETLLATADSTELPADSVDLAFICDTYHHFEFPQKTLASLYRAVKPGGRVVLIDFRRFEGTSSDWVLDHVRAGQEVFESEVAAAGFKKVREEPDLLEENYLVVFEKPEQQADAREARGPGRGMGRGTRRGMGRQRGAEPDLRADQAVFHTLLENHKQIRRTVQRLDDGVETLTESDNPEIAAQIQAHASAMHDRIETGRGLRHWDDLFAAIFAKHAQIKMTVENTARGVRVKETSSDPVAVTLIQAHADVVSRFVAYGFDEAHKNHPVPAASSAKPEVSYPIIAGFGGVVPKPQADEPPRAGGKVLLDVTAGGAPAELNKGLDRAARLLNLYGTAGLQAADVRIVVVLHGDATSAALNDAAYQARFATEKNPNLPLVAALRDAGVEIFVCGQALAHKGFADREVADGVQIAAAALTVLMNRQADGYAFVLVP